LLLAAPDGRSDVERPFGAVANRSVA